MRHWHINDTTTITVSDAQSRTSDNSLLFSGTGGYTCQIVFLESNTNYVISAYTWQLAGSNGARMSLQLWEYDAGGVYQEDANGLPTLTGTNYHSEILAMGTREEWVRGTGDFTTPGGTGGLKPYIVAFNTDTNDTGDGFYLDDVMLHRGVDTALPYQPHVTDYFYEENLLTEVENYNTFIELSLPNTLVQTNESTGSLYLDVFNQIDVSQPVYIFDNQSADSQDPASEVQTNYVDNTIGASNIRAWREVGNSKRIYMTAKPTSTLWVYYEPTSVMVLNGSLIVEGSILADRIAANQIDGTHISASSDILIGSGDESVKISGVDATYRIWAGNETAPASAKFSVDKNGILRATDAIISGTVSVGTSVAWSDIYDDGEKPDDKSVTDLAIGTALSDSEIANLLAGTALSEADVANLLASTALSEAEIAFLEAGTAISLADFAQITAEGKVTTFTALSSAEPTALAEGDLWYQTDTGVIKRWDGTDWDLTVGDVTKSAIETGFTTADGVKMNSIGIMNNSKANPGDTVPGFFMGIYGGQPQVELVGNDGNSFTYDGTALSTSGTIYAQAGQFVGDVTVGTAGSVNSIDFAKPTGAAQGVGFSLDGTDGFQAYGDANVFGGPMFFTDGTLLVSIGAYLNDITAHYPTITDLTVDSQMHQYLWFPVASAWASETTYAVGDVIYEDSSVWQCYNGGTSDTSEPTWTGNNNVLEITTDPVRWTRTAKNNNTAGWYEMYTSGLTSSTDWYIVELNNEYTPLAIPLKVSSYRFTAAISAENLDNGLAGFFEATTGAGIMATGNTGAMFDCTNGTTGSQAILIPKTVADPTIAPSHNASLGSLLCLRNSGNTLAVLWFKDGNTATDWVRIS